MSYVTPKPLIFSGKDFSEEALLKREWKSMMDPHNAYRPYLCARARGLRGPIILLLADPRNALTIYYSLPFDWIGGVMTPLVSEPVFVDSVQWWCENRYRYSRHSKTHFWGPYPHGAWPYNKDRLDIKWSQIWPKMEQDYDTLPSEDFLKERWMAIMGRMLDAWLRRLILFFLKDSSYRDYQLAYCEALNVLSALDEDYKEWWEARFIEAFHMTKAYIAAPKEFVEPLALLELPKGLAIETLHVENERARWLFLVAEKKSHYRPRSWMRVFVRSPLLIHTRDVIPGQEKFFVPPQKGHLLRRFSGKSQAVYPMIFSRKKRGLFSTQKRTFCNSPASVESEKPLESPEHRGFSAPRWKPIYTPERAEAIKKTKGLTRKQIKYRLWKLKMADRAARAAFLREIEEKRADPRTGFLVFRMVRTNVFLTLTDVFGKVIKTFSTGLYTKGRKSEKFSPQGFEKMLRALVPVMREKKLDRCSIVLRTFPRFFGHVFTKELALAGIQLRFVKDGVRVPHDGIRIRGPRRV